VTAVGRNIMWSIIERLIGTKRLERIIGWSSRYERAHEEWESQIIELHQKLDTEINPLPIEEARQQAEILLADPHRFVCQQESLTDDSRLRLQALAPYLRVFFAQYSSVKQANVSGVSLDRSLDELDDLDVPDASQYVIVGQEDTRILLAARVGEEAIYTFDEEPEEPEDEPGEPIHTFTSIYHYLIYIDRYRSVFDLISPDRIQSL
jgi:hypothetical protein